MKRNDPGLSCNRDGFTLIEMVVTIVIGAIMAVGIVNFIGNAADSVETTSNRNRLASAGRTAIDRIALELHNALPNSIRATTPTAGGDQCIEFIPVVAATSYINPPFTGSGGTTFNIVDIREDGVVIYPGAPPTKYAVIYPRRRNQMYDGDNGASTGWPNFPTRRPIQEITSIANDATTANQSTVTLIKTHRFRRRSPSQRFYVVEDPISFCVVGENLYRYTNYGFYTSQVTQEEQSGVCEVALNQRCLPNYNAAPDKTLIADSIDNTGLTAFSVTSQSLARNSLVAIEFNFTEDNDTVRLNHEVLTRSVP